jgi:hypothetical protein
MEEGHMPTTQINLFSSELVLGTLKGVTLLILIFYAIFSTIIIRQVDLMSKALITGISPIIKFLTVIHAFIALGMIVLAWIIL